MFASLEETVAALVPDWPQLSPTELSEVAGACAAFVRAQVASAPFYVRSAFAILYFAFRIYAFAVSGFAAKGKRLARALHGFSDLPVPFAAGLERLLRSSTVLAYFELPMVLAAMEESEVRILQQQYRARRALLLS